jgi:hypothetical protein
MRQEVRNLLETPEVSLRVISVLYSMGYIQKGAINYSQIQLAKKGKELIESESLHDDDVNKIRKAFPQGDRGSLGAVKAKMYEFMKNHPKATLRDIETAAKLWVEKKGKYCGNAQYFFYKKTSDGNVESRCEEFLEYIQEASHNSLEDVI